MEKYTLLEAKVNGKPEYKWGAWEIPVEINKGSVKFIGFEPTKSQLDYYLQISNEGAGLDKSGLVCDVLIYCNESLLELKEQDLIRAHMHPVYIAFISDKIEKIHLNNKNELTKNAKT